MQALLDKNSPRITNKKAFQDGCLDHNKGEDSLAPASSINHMAVEVPETKSADSRNVLESATEARITFNSKEVIVYHTKHLVEEEVADSANTIISVANATSSYKVSRGLCEASRTGPVTTVALKDSANTEKTSATEMVTTLDAANDRATQSERRYILANVGINVNNSKPAFCDTQNALLLRALKERYTLVTNHAVPSVFHDEEILIKVAAIGLNPIDWKAP